MFSTLSKKTNQHFGNIWNVVYQWFEFCLVQKLSFGKVFSHFYNTFYLYFYQVLTHLIFFFIYTHRTFLINSCQLLHLVAARLHRLQWIENAFHRLANCSKNVILVSIHKFTITNPSLLSIPYTPYLFFHGMAHLFCRISTYWDIDYDD